MRVYAGPLGRSLTVRNCVLEPREGKQEDREMKRKDLTSEGEPERDEESLPTHLAGPISRGESKHDSHANQGVRRDSFQENYPPWVSPCLRVCKVLGE